MLLCACFERPMSSIGLMRADDDGSLRCKSLGLNNYEILKIQVNTTTGVASNYFKVEQELNDLCYKDNLALTKLRILTLGLQVL